MILFVIFAVNTLLSGSPAEPSSGASEPRKLGNSRDYSAQIWSSQHEGKFQYRLYFSNSEANNVVSEFVDTKFIS